MHIIQFIKRSAASVYNKIFWKRLMQDKTHQYHENYVNKLFEGGEVHFLELISAKNYDSSYKKSVHSPQNEKQEKDTHSEEPSKYAVYINFDYQVFYKRGGAALMLSHAQNHMLAQAGKLNALPMEQLTESQKLAYKRMVGNLIVFAIENEISEAEALYRESFQYYNKRSVETFRLRQIWFSIIIYSFFGFALLCKTGNACHISNPPSIYLLMLAALAGSFFTIVKNAGKRKLDVECRRVLISCDCTARAIVAMLMGALSWYILQSDVIFVALQNVKNCTYVAFAFASGLVDSYIPSLICKSITTDCSKGEKPSDFSDCT